MPKARAKEPSKPSKDVGEEIVNKGRAYVLAELADQLGLLVRDVRGKHLANSGLPENLPHHVRLLAHQIHRDMVDSAHYRLAKAVAG